LSRILFITLHFLSDIIFLTIGSIALLTLDVISLCYNWKYVIAI
jgi:hypothetical protein